MVVIVVVVSGGKKLISLCNWELRSPRVGLISAKSRESNTDAINYYSQRGEMLKFGRPGFINPLL